MSTRIPWLTPALFGLVSACSSDGASSKTSRSTDATTHVSSRSDASSAPKAGPAAPSSTVVAADGCTGLEMHDCARTKGCLLDQPTYRTPVCRPAENACEAAIRHADLIGADADSTVTPEVTKAAEEACNGLSGCTVTSGRCSCPCAILVGDCDCSCGGSYLRRCTTKVGRAVFDGRPPADLGAGALGDLGRALVAIRRAPSGQAFVVSPIPPVDGLVGQKRNVIEGTLGTPWPCDDLSIAPCQSHEQIFYSLYKLAKGALGGGPELRLTYDAKSTCTEAKIVQTR